MPAPRSVCPALQLALFGGVTIQAHGERVTDLPTRKAEALLIYVVCNPHPHQRETLAELFWDDLPADRATANLRLTLNQLRKRFEPFLEITPTTVAIRSDIDCWVDVQEFARALAAQPREAEPLVEALNLYRGDFLAGFHLRSARGFSEWQDAQSIRWRQQALDWMHTLVERYTTRSAYSEGITWATRLLNLDPLDEVAHRQMMLLFARSGRRHDAVRQYQTCRRVLQEELGLEPEPDTEELYQQVRARPAQRQHTLPPRDGLLLGRTQNLAQVYTWLAAPDARLMTIVGPGGSGKTQLALAAGWRVATEYIGPCSDGVFYISLLSPGPDSPRIEDAELLVTIAEALQISLSGRRTLLDQLVSALLDKEILIILDNGELLAASARLALGSLLRHTRALRILVPSRERLKVREEQVLEIGGLAYPLLSPVAGTRPPDRAQPVDLSEYASVQLFLEHARRVQSIPGLDAYDRHDQIAIGQICRMVSGLPLAIGLATSWLHIRAPHEIAQDIAQTIDLLVTDMPEVPERHRSMRAVLAHSWQLLNKRERVVLVSLAVFPRSFNTAAAEQIASATLPDLAALCDKSLLQRQTTAAGTRYELHPLLRQWAIEKLQADPAAAAALQASHAHYFAAFAAQCEETLYGAQGADTFNALEREIENLRAGWRWAITARNIATLGRYSMALHDICAVRNWEIEGSQLFQQAAMVVRAWIACPDDSPAVPPAAVRVLFCYGALQYTLGDLDAAEVALQQSRPLLETYGLQNRSEQLFIHRLLGLIAYWRGAYADAMGYLRVSLQLAESVMDERKVGELLLSIGAVAYAQGDWATAQQVFQRCLAIHLTLAHQWGIGHARRFLGMVAAMRGDTQGARHEYQESLTIAQQLGNRLGEALVLDQLGLLYLMERQIEQAQSALQGGLQIFQELGIELGNGRVLCHLARLRNIQQRYSEACQYAREAMRVAQRVQAPPLLIECAATAAQLWLQTEPDTTVDSAVHATLLSLWRHPACSADTRYYIESFFPDLPAAHAPGAGELDRNWSLEQAQRVVIAWMDGTLQSRLEGYGQLSSK